MDEYIERAEALHILGTMPLDWEYGRGVSDCYDAIGAIPAADVAPVRHGRWVGPETEKDDPKIERGLERWHCSCCGCEAYVSFGPPVGRFCLMCGAKMDEIERRK